MSSSALNQGVLQAKINNVQNQADTSAVYSAGVWSFKNSTALTSVTITDAGNVGIGTTSLTAGYRMTVNGSISMSVSEAPLSWTGNGIVEASSSLYLRSTGAANVLFQTNGAERMRIDASGNLLVGKTAVSTTTAGGEIRPGGGLTVTSAQSTNSSTTLEVYSTGASNFRFYVGLGGTVYATSTTITGISDERLKENVRDLDDGLNVVLALKPRKFDWKEGKGANIKNARGFIAQEFEQVLPDMVEEWKDPAPEGEEPYKAVNANLIPTLVKAIQELSAKVDAQAAEIEALKAK